MTRGISTVPDTVRYSSYFLLIWGLIEVIAIMSYLPGFMNQLAEM